MPLVSLLVATIWLGAPALAEPAQPPSPSPADAAQSTARDGFDLPVSLDRIRDGLAQPAPTLRLHVEIPANFRTAVQEQQKLDDLIKSFDFTGGPVPAGGLYAYEQQRAVLSPTDYPLMQPYAAFSGPELLTVAIEDVAGHDIGRRALGALRQAERARAASAAREEVLQSITDYCSAQPDKGASLPICQTASETMPVTR